MKIWTAISFTRPLDRHSRFDNRSSGIRAADSAGAAGNAQQSPSRPMRSFMETPTPIRRRRNRGCNSPDWKAINYWRFAGSCSRQIYAELSGQIAPQLLAAAVDW
jgi:hypothetical protein